MRGRVCNGGTVEMTHRRGDKGSALSCRCVQRCKQLGNRICHVSTSCPCQDEPKRFRPKHTARMISTTTLPGGAALTRRGGRRQAAKHAADQALAKSLDSGKQWGQAPWLTGHDPALAPFKGFEAEKNYSGIPLVE